MVSQNTEFIYSNETFDNNTGNYEYMDLMRVIVKEAEDLVSKNLKNPIKANSITVPQMGYSLIRFEANNPGNFTFFNT